MAVKNKRNMREVQRADPIAPKRYPRGTKKNRTAVKFEKEKERKKSK